MRPPPVSVNVVVVAILSDCSHPEEVSPWNTGLFLFIRGVEIKQLRLDPVVNWRMGNLNNPTTVTCATVPWRRNSNVHVPHDPHAKTIRLGSGMCLGPTQRPEEQGQPLRETSLETEVPMEKK